MAWNTGFKEWLSYSKQMENAQMVANHFYKNGSDWTKESICAMLGNMSHESSVNPNMYEYGYGWTQDRGYGLVQWTPRSKYWNWALNNKLDPEKPESQLERITYETKNNIQWVADRLYYGYGYYEHSYKGSFSDFRKNKDKLNVNQLTEAFMWNYEGPAYTPAKQSLAQRQKFANDCYKNIKWGDKPTPDPDPKPDPTPEPKPDPKPETDNIADFFEKFVNDFVDNIEKAIKKNVYFYNNDNMISNDKLQIKKITNNMYNVDMNKMFKDMIKKLVEDGKKGLADSLKDIVIDFPDPNPEPKPEPTPEPKPTGYIFPLKNSKYIGFQLDGQKFGMTSYNRCEGTGYCYYHNGVDFGNSHYNISEMVAVGDGEIISVGYKSGIGAYVYLKSGSYYFLYQEYDMYNDNNFVKVGQKVKKGEVIAKASPSGYHMHFGCTKEPNLDKALASAFNDNGVWLDPISVLTGGKCKGNTLSGNSSCFA